MRGDAKSLIDQMRGASGVRSEDIRPYYLKARRLADHLEKFHWVWTPRKNNREADGLSRRAMRQVHRDPNAYREHAKVAATYSPEPLRLLPVLDLRVYL